ncbi:MAG: hypothetical protein AVDCRST_MAG59-397, partial [uncultured Thermomicrobiales bacterium]
GDHHPAPHRPRTRPPRRRRLRPPGGRSGPTRGVRCRPFRGSADHGRGRRIADAARIRRIGRRPVRGSL